MICDNCGVDNPYNAKFCLNCGVELQNRPDKSRETSNDTNWTCPLCKSSQLKKSVHKGTLGFGNVHDLECPNCEAEFDKKGDKYRLSRFSDHTNEIWRRYRYQTLTIDEWIEIANGGVSDAEQREIDEENKKKELRTAEIQHENDIKTFINKLQHGMITINTSDNSPIIPKRNEKTSIVMNNISLLEPRSIHNFHGGYGGPTIRVAKGVSFRVGGFAGQGESHEEIRNIDKGTLVLTNKRLIFIGSKRTTNIDLRRIIAIKSYKDGVESQRTDKQKSEYFTGTDKSSISFTTNGKRNTIPITGVVLKAAIMGNITKLG